MFERKSTGIALEADGTVRVVELTATIRAMTLSRMESFPAEASEPFSSWKQALEKASESGFDLESSVVGITDSLTYRKSLSFPFRSRKRIMQILESELEGEIPVPSDTVVADFLTGSPMDKGVQGTAIACSKETLASVLQMFGGGTRLRGVQILSVGLVTACRIAGVREGIAVCCNGGEAILVEIRSSFLMSVRRFPVSGNEDRDIESLTDGILALTREGDDVILACPDPVTTALGKVPGLKPLKLRRYEDLSLPGSTFRTTGEIVHYASSIGLALRGLGSRESLPFDLRQGPFVQITPLANLKRPAKRTAVIGLCVLLLFAMNLLVGTAKVKMEYRRYSSQLEAEFKEHFPEIQFRHEVAVKLAEEQLVRLQSKMADMSGLDDAGALMVLSMLSAAIPGEINMKVDELSYDSKKLRLEGIVSSFDAVDRVKSALDEGPFFTDVQVQNARIGADVNKINFRLQMEVR